ncbi:hypothetical protein EII17_05555 [Clostridiales bacterium COT073_COT-073]|nr:hypothetical protein EII17_05555 [Clostridiales bacterium COT073_COT-073]
MQLYNQEQIWDLMMEEKYQLGLDEGREEGREEGSREEKYKIAETLKGMGLSSEDIYKATGVRL